MIGDVVDLPQLIAELLKKHGSYRATEKALKIDCAYLFRMRKGIKKNPSPEVMKKLGIESVTYFRRTK